MEPIWPRRAGERRRRALELRFRANRRSRSCENCELCYNFQIDVKNLASPWFAGFFRFWAACDDRCGLRRSTRQRTTVACSFRIDMIERTKNAESRLGSNRERRSRIRTFDMACLAADHDDLESAESPPWRMRVVLAAGHPPPATASCGAHSIPLPPAARVGAIWSSGIRRRLASTRFDPSSRQSPRSCAPTRAGKRRARRGRRRETIRSVPPWGHREFASWS